MSDIIGPALPPHMRKKSSETESEVGIGPSSPKVIPKDHLSKREKQPDASETRKNRDYGIGPALPPWMVEKKETCDEIESFGPSLPPKCSPVDETAANTVDEDIIGPLPPKDSDNVTTLAEDIEKRSKKMKNRLLGLEEPKKLEREEWMLELPPVLQGFSTGPRKFRAHERVIGDRSVWTDTPADKARKIRADKPQDSMTDEDRIAAEAQAKRDVEIAEMLASDDSRNDSLMSMHEKERKRKADEAEAAGEAKLRRPFDRDIDLRANQFDDAAKKRLLKQSQGLSSRFSSGAKTAKFL